VQLLEKRLAALQTDKTNVRVKLQKYQEKFAQEHDRKIRFHKDIAPIERDYRMYKQVKEEIAKLESQLSDARRASGM